MEKCIHLNGEKRFNTVGTSSPGGSIKMTQLRAEKKLDLFLQHNMMSDLARRCTGQSCTCKHEFLVDYLKNF